LLSALAKPLLPLFAVAPWAVLMRSTDRLGKGIRSGARDALLANEATPEQRGRVFGFHRAMDTLGAVIGPLLALWWLWTHPGGNYTSLFALALIPGLLSVALLLVLRENKPVAAVSSPPPSPFAAFSYWKRASRNYKRLTGWLVAFALFNSSDVFLLLLARTVLPEQLILSETTFSADFCVIGLYIFYNLVYALAAYPAGRLSDTLHPRLLLTVGLVCFAVAYGGLGWLSLQEQPPLYLLVVFFLIYGLYTACTDGVSKAWLSGLCTKTDKGAALGLQAGLMSLAALVASSCAGLLWHNVGAYSVFLSAAVAAVLCGAGLWLAGPSTETEPS
jgi:MFS family permease